MSAAFHRSEALRRLGIEHGLGKRGSDAAAPLDLYRARQVHGNAVVEFPGSGSNVCADALLTRTPGVAVGIQTADCVPILLTDEPRNFVAAIHAGWRGSSLEIARTTVETLCERFSFNPAAMTAVIGPHAGPCCYEVDAPVRGAFDDRADRFFEACREGHFMLDLHALNAAQLVAAGVPAEGISRVGGCSICDPHGYPSHRRDRESGRMVHFIQLP
jgi:YfiH family protein